MIDREAVLDLRTEVNCRIQHGAESGGHLEYVQRKLDEMLGYPNLPENSQEKADYKKNWRRDDG